MLKDIDIKNVDATIDSIKEIDNKLPLWEFFENVFLGKPDNLKILIYGIEGDPAIIEINFDGREIRYNYTSQEVKREYVGNGFKKVRRGIDINYDLYQNDEYVTTMIFYSSYR